LRDQVQQESEGSVTPQVSETIRRMIAMIEETIEPAIDHQFRSDRAFVGDKHRFVVECRSRYDQAQRRILSEVSGGLSSKEASVLSNEAKVNTSRLAVAYALEKRNRLAQANNTKCCEKYSFRDFAEVHSPYVGCDYEQETAADCALRVNALIAGFDLIFKRQASAYDTLKLECHTAGQTLHAAIIEYMDAQATYQARVEALKRDADLYNTELQQLTNKASMFCKTYYDCHTSTSAVYADVIVATKEMEEVRQEEWNTTQTIKCMLASYGVGGPFNNTSLHSCYNNIAPWHLVIPHPEVPIGPDRPDSELCMKINKREFGIVNASEPEQFLETPECETRRDVPPMLVVPPDCPVSCP